MFVREEDFIHAKVPRFTTIRLNYVAESSPELRAAGGWPGDRESAWVRTYNPDQRVIVIVLREGKGTSAYLAGGPVRPSVAFQRELAKQN